MKSLLNQIKQRWDSGGKIISLSLFIFVFLVFIIGYAILHIGGPKTPVTADQVFEIMKAEGYYPTDATQHYRENGVDRTDLVEVVQISTDDFTLAFFEFLDDDGAKTLYRSVASKIRTDVYKSPNIEYSASFANFTIYTIQTDDQYAANVRVGNTEVYALGSKDSASDIHSFLVQIGYFKE